MKIANDTRVKILTGEKHHIGMVARVNNLQSNGDCIITLGPEKMPANVSNIDPNPDNESESLKMGFSYILVK